MKKLLFLFVLVAGMAFSMVAQEDSAVVFTNDTTSNEVAEVLTEIPFAVLDTINFNAAGDPNTWELTEWIIKSTTIVNPTTRRVRYVQYKINGQGVREKRVAVIKYTKTVQIHRKIK